MESLQYYAQTEKEMILKELSTFENGLSEKEAEARIHIHGHNEPVKKEKHSMFKQIALKFKNPLIIMLLIIVIVSWFFGEKISALFVFLMILISIFISFIQEYKSSEAVEKLQELVRTKVTVLRDGKIKDIDIRKIVPGDIIDLNAGDMIAADMRIIQCKDLFINQASLTGESFPVEKTEQTISNTQNAIPELSNIAFMGSSVVSGTGLGLVVKTGASTQFGEISHAITKAKVKTTFDEGIKQFTMMMIRFIIVLIVLIFIVITFFKHGTIIEALLFSLAVAVGLTPEMLPMFVTINLSKAAIAMSKKKVIIKHLHSIQNFGAMDVLCTDKTGTLTENKIVLEKHCDIHGQDNEDVLRYAYINSLYHTGLKSLLDQAIIKHEKRFVVRSKKIDEIPFDFSRKLMSVVIEENNKHEIILKGAPEEVFKRCTHYELNGKVQKIHAKIFAQAKEKYEALSNEGFRVLAIAYKEIKEKKKIYSKNDEAGLVLKGFTAFLDPPKHSVKPTLISLNKLGIEIKILTGDNEIITRKICNEVELQIKGIITGIEIDALRDEELQEVVEKTTIFARLTPLQKERIIRILHKNTHTVGYLGDGINDAPSLRAADVGISVNNAVDIAKESAEIILMEKSLYVLHEGVIDGRITFGNIIKYIKMSASSNFGNMLSMTGATLLLPFLPMLPVQILLNNFLYDLSNLSVPTDGVDKEYIMQPRKWNIHFIRKFMLFIGPLSSLYDFMTYGVMLFIFHAPQELFHTGWFIESLCSQTLVIYVIRTNKIPFIESKPSKWLLVSTITILLFAFALPFTSFATLFGFTPLPPLYFAILAGMMITYLLLVHVVKTWMTKKYGYQ